MGAICFFDGYLLNMKEPRMTAKGNTVQSFGLPVLTTPAAQQNTDRYSIFNFVAFGDTAEQLAKEYQAGKTYAHIQGAPHIEKYVDSTGAEKKSVSFWANKVYCYSKSQTSGKDPAPMPSGAPKRNRQYDDFEDVPYD